MGVRDNSPGQGQERVEVVWCACRGCPPLSEGWRSVAIVSLCCGRAPSTRYWTCGSWFFFDAEGQGAHGKVSNCLTFLQTRQLCRLVSCDRSSGRKRQTFMHTVIHSICLSGTLLTYVLVLELSERHIRSLPAVSCVHCSTTSTGDTILPFAAHRVLVHQYDMSNPLNERRCHKDIVGGFTPDDGKWEQGATRDHSAHNNNISIMAGPAKPIMLCRHVHVL